MGCVGLRAFGIYGVSGLVCLGFRPFRFRALGSGCLGSRAFRVFRIFVAFRAFRDRVLGCTVFRVFWGFGCLGLSMFWV